MQGNNRIATVCSHKCLLIITTYVISFIIPLVRITSRDFDMLSQRLAMCKIQRYIFACRLRLLHYITCYNFTAYSYISYVMHVVTILELVGGSQLCRNAARNASVLYAASASTAHIYHTYGIGPVSYGCIKYVGLRCCRRNVEGMHTSIKRTAIVSILLSRSVKQLHSHIFALRYRKFHASFAVERIWDVLP